MDSGNKASLNQKTKVLIYSKKEFRSKCKKATFIGLLELLGLLLLMILPLYNIKSVKKLKRFELDGFYMFQHFPTTSIVGYALLDKYFSEQYNGSYVFTMSKFQANLETLKMISEYSYRSNEDIQSLYF